MPTRSKSARSRSKARGTQTVRTRSRSTGRAKNPVTVAAKQVADTVNEVRRNPRKLKNLGKAAAVAAGIVTAGLLLRRRKGKR